jgi:diadenosine tetraphosphate (Ap4A) HIT family hydrolase
VCTVGVNVYLALAKGPLVDEHTLLLPIEHVGSYAQLTRDGKSEMNRWKVDTRCY